MSRKDAANLNVTNGDIVEVSNKWGSIRLRVKISNDIPPGLVFVYRSASTVDLERVNVLSDPGIDSHGGSVYNSTQVRIRKVPVKLIQKS